jgi:hypothetical protein
MTTSTYCFDTSAFLEGWVRLYPYDVFPALWDNLEKLIEAQIAISSEEVYNEIARKEDTLLDWVKNRRNMFAQIDIPQQEAVAKILSECPRLVDTKRGKSSGDPWVIALAMITQTAVVTAERISGSVNSPRIPDVCQLYGIRCITLLDLIREQKWRF